MLRYISLRLNGELRHVSSISLRYISLRLNGELRHASSISLRYISLRLNGELRHVSSIPHTLHLAAAERRMHIKRWGR